MLCRSMALALATAFAAAPLGCGQPPDRVERVGAAAATAGSQPLPALATGRGGAGPGVLKQTLTGAIRPGEPHPDAPAGAPRDPPPGSRRGVTAADGVVPPRVRKAIDWGAAREHPAAAQPLPALAQATLARADLPVLLLAGAEWRDGTATAERDWYVMSSRSGDLTVVVQGDRVATVDSDMAPPGWRAPTWQAPLVTTNEGIIEATFLAFGASYAVAVECAEPDRDPRCTGEAFVRALVADLRRFAPTEGP